LNPQAALRLVVRGEHDLIAFAHRVEEVLAAAQTCVGPKKIEKSEPKIISSTCQIPNTASSAA